MKKRIATSIILLLFLLIGVTQPASAQTYYFQVDQATADAYYQADGTLSILYQYVFVNDPSASPIEYVDIGLPNGTFNLSSVSASVDGKTITDISRADPQYLTDGSDGVTLGLGSSSIQPGHSGTVMLRVDGIQNVYFHYNKGDTKDYASVRFSPNYFGSAYVNGKSHVQVSLHLPVGVQPEEPQYELAGSGWPGTAEPSAYLDDEGRVTYTWESDVASLSTRYEFAAAFPASYIPAGAISSGVSFDPSALICSCISLLFIGLTVFAIYAGYKASKKRKLQYLPPKIAIEGHGIKRGLTAVEAAILMEQPMDKVLTMILFGVIKKGAAIVKTKEPLELEVDQTKLADLQPYETEFVAAFKTPAGKERQKEMQGVMVTLVKAVAEKMKGFSRKETVAYYDDINKRAWAQVQAAETPEVKSQKYDDYMEWTMLDRDYTQKTRDVFGSTPVILPRWWGGFDPVYRTSTVSAPSGNIMTGGGLPSRTTITLPHLPGSDFAASIANNVQSFAGNLVGDLTSFTSGITNKTNPAPPPSTYRSSGSSGHSGGCACACACACAGCACACAGGGR